MQKVFDFGGAQKEKKDDFVCTYTTIYSNAESASPEKPILVLGKWGKKVGSSFLWRFRQSEQENSLYL